MQFRVTAELFELGELLGELTLHISGIVRFRIQNSGCQITVGGLPDAVDRRECGVQLTVDTRDLHGVEIGAEVRRWSTAAIA